MAYRDEKNGSTYSTSPRTPRWPPSASSQQSTFSSLKEFEETDQKYKRGIRILRFISRTISLLISGFMIGVLSYALVKYYLTRNYIIAGNVHPWVTPATIWPTYMLLGISTVTFGMNVITLCSYMCGIQAANKTSTWATVISVILVGVHMAAWAAAAGLFKMANTGSDLWGYSCGDASDAIQDEVQSFLDFGKLCTLQGGAWNASIVEAAGYLLTFIITLLVMRRKSHRKKMERVRSSLTMESEYNAVYNAGYNAGCNRAQNFEMGAVHMPSSGHQYIPLDG